MKIFISQPMSGRSDVDIEQERRLITQDCMGCFDNVEIINSWFHETDAQPLYLLGKSIELLSEADLVVFASNWENSRGCNVERKCCDLYGVAMTEWEDIKLLL